MRRSHAFRPDALDDLLEGRQVLSQITALAPLAADLSTFNSTFALGTQLNPNLSVGQAFTNPTTSLAIPLALRTGFAPAGLGGATSFLNGFTPFGIGTLGGLGTLTGFNTIGANFGINPFTGLGSFFAPFTEPSLLSNSGLSPVATANFATNGVAIPNAQFATSLLPVNVASFFNPFASNTLGLGTALTPTVTGSAVVPAATNASLGFINGLGMTNGLNGMLNFGPSAIGLSAATPVTNLTGNFGITTNPSFLTSANQAALTTAYMPLILGNTAFTANPFISPYGLANSFTTNPYVNPVATGGAYLGLAY